MNTKEKAYDEIMAFLRGDGKYLLVTGTHQHKKHQLVLAALSKAYIAGIVLMRVNSMSNLSGFLGMGHGNVRLPVSLGPLTLFADTMNRRSWDKSPEQVGVGLIYPIDSLDADGGSECVEDMKCRGASKICLVTWTDNTSIEWVDHLNPTRVIYDAEAEDPDYHQRMLELLGEAKPYVRTPANLPEYAKDADPAKLIKLTCRGCRKGRWAELNKPNPGNAALHAAAHGEYVARCLSCGYENDDNYNW